MRNSIALHAALFVMIASTAEAAGNVAGEINVYSSRHYNTDQVLYDAFTEATGIGVNLIEAKGDALIERMVAEGESSPADVFITADGSRLARAVEAGLFQPADSEVLSAAVPANLRHPDGLWYGLSTRVRGIIYAKDRVAEDDIRHYEDLADPQWAGKICIRSSSNVYNQSLAASMIATVGLEAAEIWATGLVANLARNPQGGDTDQIKAVAAGECDLAVANHYYFARLMTSDKPEDQDIAQGLNIIFPNQDDRGAHINVSGAGIAAHAPNQEAAVKFLEYLVTPAAQAGFASGNYEYPVIDDVKLTPILEGWGDYKTDAVSIISYGEYNAEALKMMDRVGWR
ncbi:MAG: Fe(3+) ABC transporter substrate-binding protein [Geminicoccaceae bacterium]